MPGVPVREIAAVDAADDTRARDAMAALATAWPGFETVSLYEGERLVAVLASPSPGVAMEPVVLDQAA